MNFVVIALLNIYIFLDVVKDGNIPVHVIFFCSAIVFALLDAQGDNRVRTPIIIVALLILLAREVTDSILIVVAPMIVILQVTLSKWVKRCSLKG